MNQMTGAPKPKFDWSVVLDTHATRVVTLITLFTSLVTAVIFGLNFYERVEALEKKVTALDQTIGTMRSAEIVAAIRKIDVLQANIDALYAEFQSFKIKDPRGKELAVRQVKVTFLSCVREVTINGIRCVFRVNATEPASLVVYKNGGGDRDARATPGDGRWYLASKISIGAYSVQGAQGKYVKKIPLSLSAPFELEIMFQDFGNTSPRVSQIDIPLVIYPPNSNAGVNTTVTFTDINIYDVKPAN